MRLLVFVAALALAPRPADACPEVGFGELIDAVAKAFDSKQVAVSTPIVIPSVGVSRDGRFAGVSIGWGVGEKQIGGLFPGTTVQRVLLHVRRSPASDEADTTARMTTELAATRSPTTLALTYGWFGHVPSLFDAGLDLGVAGASTSHLGPIAQLTGGMGGIGVRLSGGVELGDDTRVTGAAELVVDVLVLVQSVSGR